MYGGTPSIEIELNELVALSEIDFEARTRKIAFPRLHFLRVGTSGGLQATTALGTSIITTYAVGLDNTGLYYEGAYPNEACQRIEQELASGLQTVDARRVTVSRMKSSIS